MLWVFPDGQTLNKLPASGAGDCVWVELPNGDIISPVDAKENSTDD